MKYIAYGFIYYIYLHIMFATLHFVISYYKTVHDISYNKWVCYHIFFFVPQQYRIYEMYVCMKNKSDCVDTRDQSDAILISYGK